MKTMQENKVNIVDCQRHILEKEYDPDNDVLMFSFNKALPLIGCKNLSLEGINFDVKEDDGEAGIELHLVKDGVRVTYPVRYKHIDDDVSSLVEEE